MKTDMDCPGILGRTLGQSSRFRIQIKIEKSAYLPSVPLDIFMLSGSMGISSALVTLEAHKARDKPKAVNPIASEITGETGTFPRRRFFGFPQQLLKRCRYLFPGAI